MEYYDMKRRLLDLGFSCRPNMGLHPSIITRLDEKRGVAVKQLYLIAIDKGIVVKVLPTICPYSHVEIDYSMLGRRGTYREDDTYYMMTNRRGHIMYPEREAIVAISLTREIYLNHISPNITPTYDILYCPYSYPTTISRCTMTPIETEGVVMSGHLSSAYDRHEYGDATIIIASEKMDDDLHDLISTLSNRDHILLSITFQVLWTLWRLRKYYIVFKHNDLGPGNILIQEVDPHSVLSYIVNDTIYTVPTYGYIAKLWDFDKVDLHPSFWKEKSSLYPWLKVYPSIGVTPPDEIMYSEKILEIYDHHTPTSHILKTLIHTYENIQDKGDVMSVSDHLFYTFLSLINRNGPIMSSKIGTS